MVRICRNLLFAFLAVLSACCWWTPAAKAEGDASGWRIADCPHRPNCVSSTSPVRNRWIAPLDYSVSSGAALDCLKRIILRMKRTTLVAVAEGYLHAEFRTILGFVDDVEFQLDGEKRIVHMRSASRVGYWDFGVNRRRLEAIRRIARLCE